MKPDAKRQSVNKLLNSLEARAFERVAKKLTRVNLRLKQVVYKPNEPIDHVIFPENAVLCLMTLMLNGDTIEAATVGREGASWISAAAGAPSMPCETIVVIEGTGLRLPIADLNRELKVNDHFLDVLTKYSHALLIASMRTSACHGLHELQERCARWILMTLDRVDSDRFAVTKEFLAQLLGTNRPTASVLVSTLEKAGILRMEGRWVTVADRHRLRPPANATTSSEKPTKSSVQTNHESQLGSERHTVRTVRLLTVFTGQPRAQSRLVGAWTAAYTRKLRRWSRSSDHTREPTACLAKLWTTGAIRRPSFFWSKITRQARRATLNS